MYSYSRRDGLFINILLAGSQKLQCTVLKPDMYNI